MYASKYFARRGIECKNCIGTGRRCDDRCIVITDLDRKGSCQRHFSIWVVWREWFQLKKFWFFRFAIFKSHTGDLVKESSVFQFLQAVFFCTGFAVSVITSVGLCNKYLSVGINRESVKQRSQCINNFDKLVSVRIENV